VVNALVHSDALPENLRAVLKTTLPVVLDANKADRHAFEAEVVAQAQEALGAVQKALEQAVKDAEAKQNEVIAPAERTRRGNAKTEADTHLEAVKAKMEADKANRKAADQAVDEASSALKAAEKEEKAAEKELQKLVTKKDNVSNVLANEFVMVRDGTTGGKKAVQKVIAVGKEYGLDGTLLQTLPHACGKPVEQRTEFESMMFTNLQSLMERVIAGLSQNVAEAEPVKNAKTAAVAAAKAASDQAQAVLKAAEDTLEATQQSQRDAMKAVSQAESHRRKLWDDMRNVCDAQDSASFDLKNLKENIWPSFEKLREKVPEPEPVEEPEPMEEDAPVVPPEASPEESAEASPEASPVAEAAAPAEA